MANKLIKANAITDENGIIIELREFPLDANLPIIELENYNDVKIGVDLLLKGKRRVNCPEGVEKNGEFMPEEETYYEVIRQQPSQAFLQKQSKEKSELEEYQAQKLEERKLELEIKIAHLRNKQPMVKLFGLGLAKTPAEKLLEKYEFELEKLK